MKNIVLVFSILFILGCDSSSSSSDKQPELGPAICSEDDFPGALKTQIQTTLSNDFSLVPGVVVAIYHPEHGYLISPFGESDTANNTAMSADSVFDVGSVHKVMKWVLLEKLVDDEAINFEDEINLHISSPLIAAAKVKDLPFHATGMVDIDESVYTDIWIRTSSGTTTFQYTYSEIIAFLEAENDTGITNGFIDSFTLGQDYNYSSYGPVLAGEVARQVTGNDPLTNLRAVLSDLFLENTTFHGYDDIPEKLVKGYGNDYDDPITDPTGEHPPSNQNLMLATSSAVTGAIFSSACDLAHMSRTISESDLGYLSKEIIDSRIANARDVGGYLKAGRGLVKYHSQYDSNFWVHAGDGAHGHSSLTGYNPDTKISVAVLTNFNPAYMDYNYSDEYAAQFSIVQLIGEFYQ
jgi:CubicO group peptidase (beta-lactamase class C family)